MPSVPRWTPGPRASWGQSRCSGQQVRAAMPKQNREPARAWPLGCPDSLLLLSWLWGLEASAAAPALATLPLPPRSGTFTPEQSLKHHAVSDRLAFAQTAPSVSDVRIFYLPTSILPMCTVMCTLSTSPPLGSLPKIGPVTPLLYVLP